MKMELAFKILMFAILVSSIVGDAIYDAIKGELNHVLGVIVAFTFVFFPLFLMGYWMEPDTHYTFSLLTCVYWVILRFGLFDLVYYKAYRIHHGRPHPNTSVSDTSTSWQDQFLRWVIKKNELNKEAVEDTIVVAKYAITIISTISYLILIF